MSAQPKYILVERIAQGGMAEIHLGKIVGSDGFARVCAFKRILPNFAHDHDFVQMFRQEAMVAKQLVNKNIVQVYDFQPDNDSYVLVMEYVDGQDLRSVLANTEALKKKFPIEVAIYIAIETLNGLGYAHSAVDVTGRPLGIVHRDVSPQNILISFDGDVKITDFGIAKSQNQSSGTRAGVLKGKFRYMSPEQAMGQNVNCQTDIFAMGVVLWEMVTMHRLFKGEDMVVLELVRQAKIKPPSQVVGTHRIPAELDNIIMKMLKKEQNLRFETARDAVRELNRFLYTYKPEFFSGELSEFMQEIFKDKIDAIRQKMRTTLALPVNMEGHHSSENGPPSQILDLTKEKKGEIVRKPAGGIGAQGKNGPRSPGGMRSPGMGRPSSDKPQRDEFKIEVDQSNQAPQKPLEAPKPGGPGKPNHLSVSIQRQDQGGGSGGQSAQGADRSSAAVQPVAFQFQRQPRPTMRHVWERILLWVLGSLATVFLLLSFLKSTGRVWRTEIILQGVPPGKVTIDIDGKKMEGGNFVSLPQKISIDSGSKYITLTRPGFKPKRIRLDAAFFGETRKETVVFEKSGKVGQIRILTTPPGAMVNLDLADESGNSPHTFEYIPLKTRLTFTISHPLCGKYIHRETLKEEQEKSLVVRNIKLPNCK
jgi:serine/threonine-protein kinase